MAGMLAGDLQIWLNLNLAGHEIAEVFEPS